MRHGDAEPRRVALPGHFANGRSRASDASRAEASLRLAGAPESNGLTRTEKEGAHGETMGSPMRDLERAMTNA